jgi:hypothetical protein
MDDGKPHWHAIDWHAKAQHSGFLIELLNWPDSGGGWPWTGETGPLGHARGQGRLTPCIAPCTHFALLAILGELAVD